MEKYIVFGEQPVVINSYLDGVKSGVFIDFDGFEENICKAGHAIIRKSNKYKPMPVIDGAYGTLPEGYQYAGILVASVVAEEPLGAILTFGEVNGKTLPYDISPILSDFLTDVPTIRFTGVGGGGVTPSPTPIQVVGVAQVFKNADCLEYADGQSPTVFVRVNTDIGYGQARWWQGYPDDSKDLNIDTPSNVDPDVPYKIRCWMNWYSDDLSSPFVAGAVIECTNSDLDFIPVNDPKVVFE